MARDVLTDDSGVGNPHKEPGVPCYFVTKLIGAAKRIVCSKSSSTPLDATG
jgi:hypothetical protein